MSLTAGFSPGIVAKPQSKQGRRAPQEGWRILAFRSSILSIKYIDIPHRLDGKGRAPTGLALRTFRDISWLGLLCFFLYPPSVISYVKNRVKLDDHLESRSLWILKKHERYFYFILRNKH